MLVIVILIYILAWLFFLWVVASFFVFKCWQYPPYIPSFGKVKHTLLQETAKILKSARKPLVVSDLGCGDGCLLARLAQQFPQHKFIGYEWNPLPFYVAKLRLKKYPNVRVIKADVMHENLSSVDVVVCYWLSKKEYAQKLARSLKKSAIIVSEIFKIEGWKVHKKVVSQLFGFQTRVFIYHMCEQAARKRKK